MYGVDLKKDYLNFFVFWSDFSIFSFPVFRGGGTFYICSSKLLRLLLSNQKGLKRAKTSQQGTLPEGPLPEALCRREKKMAHVEGSTFWFTLHWGQLQETSQ